MTSHHRCKVVTFQSLYNLASAIHCRPVARYVIFYYYRSISAILFTWMLSFSCNFKLNVFSSRKRIFEIFLSDCRNLKRTEITFWKVFEKLNRFSMKIFWGSLKSLKIVFNSFVRIYFSHLTNPWKTIFFHSKPFKCFKLFPTTFFKLLFP